MSGSGARQNRASRRRHLQKQLSAEENSQKPEKVTKNHDKLLKITTFWPKSPGQHVLKTALAENRLVFACGPAGTGKTRACVDRAVDLLLSEQVEKLVFCRPAVPADEDIGALPGDVREKLAGYLQPLLDELSEKLGGGAAANHMIEKWFRDGTLQIVPVGMMRGRTFKNTAIVADEMQNATLNQIKMVVTRLGQGSTMAITGDTEQSDLGARSGLSEALKRFEDNGYPVIRLDRGDVQRDPIVADILRFL